VTDAQAAQTRAVVQELHKAYREGSAERVAALIHDDIDWCIYGPSRVFAFEGPRRGKAQVMDVLAAIGQQFELKRYEHELLIVEGERAAVLSQTSFVQRATGRTLSIRLINFIRVRDSKIIEFREFSDTFDVVEQAMGAWLEVPLIPA
jgi:ketosteroid isomerase-like protein